jgi:hypothetical protein
MKQNKSINVDLKNESLADAKPVLDEVNLWCKWIGHKFVPVYIKGEYNGKVLKFIGTYCDRCGKGQSELHKINNAAINREYGTYSEQYFDG